MRNISFSHTIEQMKNRTKFVTRRLGWKFLLPGMHVMACEKCMGLQKGEKIVRLGVIEIVDVHREMLVAHITKEEVIKEGFPDMSPEEFIWDFIGIILGFVWDFIDRYPRN